jgi:hypothetical protein
MAELISTNSAIIDEEYFYNLAFGASIFGTLTRWASSATGHV